MTRDGLRIQIVDEQNRPMFDTGSAVVKPYMREILHEIGHVLNDVPNHITLSGHTDASPIAGGDRGYSNWELSATAPTPRGASWSPAACPTTACCASWAWPRASCSCPRIR